MSRVVKGNTKDNIEVKPANRLSQFDVGKLLNKIEEARMKLPTIVTKVWATCELFIDNVFGKIHMTVDSLWTSLLKITSSPRSILLWVLGVFIAIDVIYLGATGVIKQLLTVATTVLTTVSTHLVAFIALSVAVIAFIAANKDKK